MVEIVFHEPERNRRTFGKRLRQRDERTATPEIGNHAIDQPKLFAPLRIEPLRQQHEFACPGRICQPCEQPGDPVIARKANAGITSGHDCELGRNSDIAGQCESHPGAGSRSGQCRNRGLPQSNQRAGQGALAVFNSVTRSCSEVSFFISGTHTLDVAAGAECSAGPCNQDCTNSWIVATLADHATQRRRQLVRQGIPGGRAVQRNRRNPIADFAEQLVGTSFELECIRVHLPLLPLKQFLPAPDAESPQTLPA